MRVEGKKTFCFPRGQSLSVLLYLATQKANYSYKGVCYPLIRVYCNANFQGARPDHVRVEKSSYCFSRELVSFVRPKELDCFDT